MSEAQGVPPASIDVAVGGVLLANMLEGWLHERREITPEPTHELEDLRRPSPEAGLHFPEPVDAWPSAPSSGEYRAPICLARESDRLGVERGHDHHPGAASGEARHRYRG